jgi:trigger factor
MKSEIKDISPTQKEIHVEIDGESLKEAYGRVSQKYSKRASVPGFRKGYAPLDVVRLRFKEEIKSEVLQDIVPKHVAAAIEEHDLTPLSEPHLHLDDAENVKVNGSQSVAVHVNVEVMPAIPKLKYEGIEVTRRVKPVDDSQVEGLISERLEKEAALIPVEGRPSEMGDTVIADLEGMFADSPEAEPITANDLEIVLGDEVIERSFTENLVGVTADEEKEFTVVYPETFSSESLAGKTVHYKAKIKSVGKSEVPELNDEWAKSLEEGCESLEDLRTRLKADLTKYSEADADAKVRNSVIAKLIENNAFEVPNTLIENQARNLLNDFAQNLQQRGVDVSKVENDFIQMAYGNMRTQAERDIQGAMLLDKVADAENVEVTDAEVDEEIEKMAGYYRSSADEIRESLEKRGGGTDSIRNNLKTRKAIEAVVAKSVVTDGPWIDEDTTSGEAEEKEGKQTNASKPKQPSKRTAKKSDSGG